MRICDCCSNRLTGQGPVTIVEVMDEQLKRRLDVSLDLCAACYETILASRRAVDDEFWKTCDVCDAKK